MPVRRMLAVALAVALSGATRAGAGPGNEVRFDNESGQPARVKLMGPVAREIDVPEGRSRAVTVPPGAYHIKVRYGTPGRYHYSRGETFRVEETATTRARISITLHKVEDGNYDTTPITEAEYEGARIPAGASAAPVDTTLYGVRIIGPSGPAALAPPQSAGPERAGYGRSTSRAAGVGGWAKSDGVRVGDTREQVIAALGEPRGSSGTPQSESLLYANGWVDLENGVVSAVHLHAPTSRAEAERARRQAEQEREALRQALEQRRAAGAPAMVEEPGGAGEAAIGFEPREEPRVRTGDRIEMTDAWVARTLRYSFDPTDNVEDLTVLSQRRQGNTVTCMFTATVNSRIGSGIGPPSYTGPVRGTLKLVSRGNAVDFEFDYESVGSRMKHTKTKKGTITEQRGE